MKNASFSYPLDRWVNEGGAFPREVGSALAHMRVTGSVSRPRWACRFSPGRPRRMSFRKSRRLRDDHCALQYR